MRTLYADAHRLKTLILSGVEFTRRFLLHLLPQGQTHSVEELPIGELQSETGSHLRPDE